VLKLAQSMFGLTTAAMLVLLSAAVLTACGGSDDGDAAPVSAASSSALLAKIPTLGETYPAQLARFVDSGEGKDYGLAVTVAADGKAVAYLCDGKTLGRAFSGTIEDGADSATLQAVKGDGTVDLKLSGDAPSSATVKADDVSDEFTLASTKVGGYYREEVKGVTRGWVVSNALAIKGVQTKPAGTGAAANANKAAVSTASTSGISSPPLSAEDQALVGVQEDPNAPPETRAFFKNRRCNSLENRYESAGDAYTGSGGTTADGWSLVVIASQWSWCGV
jgi:hypothetical protein